MVNMMLILIVNINISSNDKHFQICYNCNNPGRKKISFLLKYSSLLSILLIFFACYRWRIFPLSSIVQIFSSLLNRLFRFASFSFNNIWSLWNMLFSNYIKMLSDSHNQNTVGFLYSSKQKKEKKKKKSR